MIGHMVFYTPNDLISGFLNPLTVLTYAVFELQHVLERFEFFPIKCKVLRARENQAKYYKDLESKVDFWGNVKKQKTKASG
jgi:hypothetical protein